MTYHFDLVKRVQTVIDERSFDITDSNFRLLCLQLIMKGGDISNVSRPFELIDKWCDILNEQFNQIHFTIELLRSIQQIGFYNCIYLLLDTVVAILFAPFLKTDSIKAKLEKWKAFAAAQRA
jgi:hypothetical protein